MAKKFPPESQDVTEPLPGMPNPIEQAYIDRMAKKKAEKDEKPEKGMSLMQTAPSIAPGNKPYRYAKGGSVSSASSRADGCAQRGKTKGRMV